MAKTLGGSYANDIRSILGAVRSLPVPGKSPAGQPAAAAAAAPFVTIKRQAGAGGRSVAERLVQRLNELDPGERPWTAWDRQLVEKVSADLDVSQQLVESLEQKNRTWLNDLLNGMRAGDGSHVDEFKIYRQVVATIRALAQVGRVVLVGRGSTYITANMPGAIHIHLTAPRDYRVSHMSQLLDIPRAEAEAEVNRIESNRNAFLKHYWPSQYQRQDLFHLTVNMALVCEPCAADVIAQLLKHRQPLET